MATAVHTRTHTQVIAEDVAAVIIHCGAVLHPAQPSHHLPAFPEAATNNHEANDDNTLHETREFWGRLQPQSLVPLLQSASSKGKGRMPSSYLPFQPPSALKSNGHLPSGHLPIERPSPSQSLPSHPSQSDVGAASSSQSGPQDGLFAYDSSPSAARQERRRRSSAAREAPAGRSVHFALPLRIESSDELDTDADQSCASSPDPCTRGSGNAIASCGDTLQQGSKSCVEIPVPERSSPLEISLRSAPNHAREHELCLLHHKVHNVTAVLRTSSQLLVMMSGSVWLLNCGGPPYEHGHHNACMTSMVYRTIDIRPWRSCIP